MKWLRHFDEAATDVEDTGSICAESNEGAAEHAIGYASFFCFYSCLWGRHFAALAYVQDLKNISRRACFCFGACLYAGGGGGLRN